MCHCAMVKGWYMVYGCLLSSRNGNPHENGDINPCENGGPKDWVYHGSLDTSKATCEAKAAGRPMFYHHPLNSSKLLDL